MQLKKISSLPENLRNTYLDSIAEPQELFIENFVTAGNAWILGESAYAIVYQHMLVELFIVPDSKEDTAAVFDAAMNASGATEVLCKSFDKQLMYAAFSKKCTVTAPGLLFRRIADEGHTLRSDVSIREGSDADINAIMRFNDDFFEDTGELQSYADSGGLYVLEKNGEIIGCGTAKQVVDSRTDVDIGMLVSARQRKQGYGTYIVSFLKNHYLCQGIRPICGCSIDNIGSQRALANAGFVSEHRILRTSYDCSRS